MAEPLIAEIKMFGGNFAPRGWAFCDGQLLPISQNTALFSLLGTTYGGDGRTTFALPDLRGRAAIGPRHGPGLSSYQLGQRGGVEQVTLTINQMPSHNHLTSTTGGSSTTLLASSANATQAAPTANSSIAAPGTGNGRNFNSTLGFNTSTPDIPLAGISSQAGNTTILNNGGNLAHENRQPFLGINYIIALIGVFPSRS